MSDNVDNREDLREIKMRIGQLDIGVAGIRREIAHAEEVDAISGVRIDRLQERMERRLELS